MSKYVIDGGTLSAIADALRTADASVAPITPEEMPEKVAGVFEAGAKSEWDSFWDAFQENGTRTAYPYGFSGQGWTKENFKPKYNMVPSRVDSMFHTSAGLSGLDLPARLSECGVTLDTSKATSVTQMFIYSYIDRVGVIDTTSAPSLNLVFGGSAIRIIDKLILKKDGSQTFSSTFSSAVKLESIMIEGTIGKNGFDVRDAKLLTHDSLLSIINALADYSADTSGTVWTVTLGATNLAKLSEDDIAIAEQKGWVLA